MRLPYRLAAMFVVVLLSVACAGTQSNLTQDVSQRAKDRYTVGMVELLSGNYTEAIEQFHEVSKSPGYVKYAALARLRIADAFLMQEKYDSAIELYRSFLKQYEGNPNSGYARFRIGQTYHHQIPADWFLAPPPYERQQIYVVSAHAALQSFLTLYPSHRFVPEATRLFADCRKKLYEHEIYVARFYRKRDKPAGVVQRLEQAFRDFPELAATEDNYLALAQAYAKTRAVDKAAAMYQAYLARFPDGGYRGQAEKSLRVLESLDES